MVYENGSNFPWKDKPFILIVDDVTKNIQVLANILADEGYDFAAATNGEQALKMLEEMQPDLVLLDIMMPGIDGHQVCSTLKKNEKTRNIPVIFLTAKSEPGDILKGFELGAVDYITKPFNATELIARVKTHIELKRNRDMVALQNTERKEMIHVLCHDLRNPLGAILAMLDLLEIAPDKRDGCDEFFRKCTSHCLKIIDQIRRIQALDSQKEALDIVPLNLKSVLEESCLILKQRFEEKELQVTIDVDDETLIFADNTTIINSVFNNILTNAVKFSFPGEKIEISAECKDDWVYIKIRDFGIGMPESLLNNIFSMRKATSRKGTSGEKGTGFGMPLVLKYVQAYGGEVTINSREKTEDSQDHGTEVIIKLKEHS